MKTDVIYIDNQGNGFDNVIKDFHKFATYMELDSKESLRLQLCAEEMLSMVRSIAGDMQGAFWIESNGQCCEMHLSTKTVMDQEKRYLLISASSSRRNEAATTFLGKLRDSFERAMLADVSHTDEVPLDVIRDINYHPESSSEWDGYERSVLRNVADDIKVFIRGSNVELIVMKKLKS